jgi:outer membrane protein assembly factor BamE
MEAQMRIYSILILLCLSLISSCSWIQFPSIHKVSVQQGNIVNQEMVSKLKIGMTMSQVQYILGTPLTTDTFDNSRWDYFYSRVDPKGKGSERQLKLKFDNEDLLLSVSGDFQLTDADPTAE